MELHGLTHIKPPILSKSQEKLIEHRRKKRLSDPIFAEIPLKPKIRRDWVPDRYETISDFFKSSYCLNGPTSKFGGVYFITYVGDEAKIKIGKGRCIDQRVRSYLTSHYRDIKVLCYVYSQTNTEGILEKDFHNFFRKDRYDREWFNSTDFLLNSIEEIKQITKFVPFVIPRKGEDIYADPNYISNKLSEIDYSITLLSADDHIT